MDPLAAIIMVGQVSAVLALYTGIITCIAQARIASQAIESIARQPSASGQITSTMFIGLAMSETGGIYGLLISIILLFANPLINRYIDFITK